jgi:hypothetical protein
MTPTESICVVAWRTLTGSRSTQLTQVRLTLVWQTLADWAKFAESRERQMLDSELFKFATDSGLEIWGPSPDVPEPLRPGK